MANPEPRVDPASEEEFLAQLYKGGELLASGRVPEAREHLERAYTLHPRNEKAQNLLGLTYFKLGIYDRAAKLYERLVNDNPADPTLRINLGLVFLKTNALPRAIREFETATDLAPEHKKAHNYLGLALAQAGEYARAREHFVLAGSDAMADKMAKAMAAGAGVPRAVPLEARAPARGAAPDGQIVMMADESAPHEEPPPLPKAGQSQETQIAFRMPEFPKEDAAPAAKAGQSQETQIAFRMPEFPKEDAAPAAKAGQSQETQIAFRMPQFTDDDGPPRAQGEPSLAQAPDRLPDLPSDVQETRRPEVSREEQQLRLQVVREALTEPPAPGESTRVATPVVEPPPLPEEIRFAEDEGPPAPPMPGELDPMTEQVTEKMGVVQEPPSEEIPMSEEIISAELAVPDPEQIPVVEGVQVVEELPVVELTAEVVQAQDAQPVLYADPVAASFAEPANAEAQPVAQSWASQPDASGWEGAPVAPAAEAWPQGGEGAAQELQSAPAGWAAPSGDEGAGWAAQAPAPQATSELPGWLTAPDAGTSAAGGWEQPAQPDAAQSWGGEAAAVDGSDAGGAQQWDASAAGGAAPAAGQDWSGATPEAAVGVEPVPEQGWSGAAPEAAVSVEQVPEQGWSGAAPEAAVAVEPVPEQGWNAASPEAAPAASVEGASAPAVAEDDWGGVHQAEAVAQGVVAAAEAPPAPPPEDAAWVRTPQEPEPAGAGPAEVAAPVAEDALVTADAARQLQAIVTAEVPAVPPPPHVDVEVPVSRDRLPTSPAVAAVQPRHVDLPTPAAGAPEVESGYAPVGAPRLADLGPQLDWSKAAVTGPFLVNREGLALRVQGELLARLLGLVAVVGQLDVKPEMKKMRGRASDQPFGEGPGQLQRILGQGVLYLEPGRAAFHSINLDDEAFYVREELLFAFEESLAFENGKLTEDSGLVLHLVHLKGQGQALLRLEGNLKSMAIPVGMPLVVPAARLVGWYGKVAPRLKGFVGQGAVELTGEGYALLVAPS